MYLDVNHKITYNLRFLANDGQIKNDFLSFKFPTSTEEFCQKQI